MKIHPNPCKTCPFTTPNIIRPEKMTEICQYLVEGVNHLCHNDRTNKTVCRGGRNFQLQIWAAMRLIESPTDASLKTAMIKVNVKPEEHI